MSAILWYVFAALFLFVTLPNLFGMTAMMRRSWGDWHPSDSIRLLSGDKVPNGMRFFIDPPKAYGNVLFAESTLNSQTKTPGVFAWLLQGLFWALVAFTTASVLLYWGDLLESPWRWFWWILPTAGAFCFGWVNVRLVSCFYVCELGAMEVCAFPPGDVLMKRPRFNLAFLEAENLDTRLGATGSATYRWLHRNGPVVGSLTVAKRENDGRPEDRFVNAVVEGWEYHCLIRIFDKLRTGLAVSESAGMGYLGVDEITFSHNEIQFDCEGQAYALQIDDLAFTKWPLSEHLRPLALAAFRDRGLHDHPTVLYEAELSDE